MYMGKSMVKQLCGLRDFDALCTMLVDTTRTVKTETFSIKASWPAVCSKFAL